MNAPPTSAFARPRDRSKRQPRHAHRDRLVAPRRSSRPRVVAVLTKHPRPVIETAIEEAAVHHHTGVPGRRQIVRAQRPIDEVEVRDPDVLLEPERNLELADPHLRGVGDVRFDVDVLPRRLPLRLLDRRLRARSVSRSMLNWTVPEDLALDPDAGAMNLVLVEVRRVVTGMHRVPLKLRRGSPRETNRRPAAADDPASGTADSPARGVCCARRLATEEPAAASGARPGWHNVSSPASTPFSKPHPPLPRRTKPSPPRSRPRRRRGSPLERPPTAPSP